MRILLVIPTCEYKNRYPVFVSNSDFPTGFAYLASALKNAGHEVFGLNPNNVIGYGCAYDMLRILLTKSVKDCQPDLIGVGGLCTDFVFLNDCIKLLRDLAPNVPIVCGGGIINNDPEFIFEALRPDFCIIGEGEETFVRLAGVVSSGADDFRKIPNIGYRRDGRALFTRLKHDYPDLDSRAFPDYEPFGVEDMLDNYGFASRYLYRYTRLDPRPMTIVTARSCPFECTFCVHHRGPKYRTRSIKNIMAEIEYLYDRYRFNILHFQDELFAASGERLQHFCETMIDKRRSHGWDFDWLFVTHASAALSEQDLRLAKDAGCYFFSYGMESASTTVLQSMNKKTKPGQLKEGIELSWKAGIGFGGNFIFGDPAETEETIDETLAFLVEHGLDNHIFLGAVRPYPGSKLFDICLDRKIIKDRRHYYDHMDESVFNMTSIPDEIWQPWINRLNQIGESFPWVAAVPATNCEEEAAQPSGTGDQEGKKMYRVTAFCPHCGAEVRCRELLSFGAKILSIPVRAAKFAHVYLTGGKAERSRLNRYVLYELMARLNRMSAKAVSGHRLFRTLDRLTKGDDTCSGPSFLTGCTVCHRRFKIFVSAHFEESIIKDV